LKVAVHCPVKSAAHAVRASPAANIVKTTVLRSLFTAFPFSIVES
jgi:hypothetical protein